MFRFAPAVSHPSATFEDAYRIVLPPQTKGYSGARGDRPMERGVWCWEILPVRDSSLSFFAGVCTAEAPQENAYKTDQAWCVYVATLQKVHRGTHTDVHGLAKGTLGFIYDADAGRLWCKSGESQPVLLFEGVRGPGGLVPYAEGRSSHDAVRIRPAYFTDLA